MGNVCLWKPSNTSLLGNYLAYKVLEEAGLPKGVINFLPGDGVVLGRTAFAHKEFAGLVRPAYHYPISCISFSSFFCFFICSTSTLLLTRLFFAQFGSE
jgi:hypothetical protein